jgi:hypothetical protein
VVHTFIADGWILAGGRVVQFAAGSPCGWCD